jgi:hypothetical protein
MRTIKRIRLKVALSTAGMLALMIAVLTAATSAPAGHRTFDATISGPATVLTGTSCTWSASTNISNPRYEWSVDDGSGSVIIGTSASVSYAFDSANGPHQALDLRVYNLAGDEAWDSKLIGVYYTGSPECP